MMDIFINAEKENDIMKQVEKWGVYELQINGPSEGNPFLEQKVIGEFSNEIERKTVVGFYDGEGIYKIRFMPSFEGTYHYKINTSFSDKVYEGDFVSICPSENNHGPVTTAYTYHFAYADGTMYYPIGTTCYAWIHQPEQRRKETLRTLSSSPFNKIRFCVFPKHYDYNFEEPELYPFESKNKFSFNLTKENFNQFTATNTVCEWDFSKYNPEFFRNIEQHVMHLLELGIQADIIIMHPYDRWGFSNMSLEEDLQYIRYLISRLSAYRNVWWSLANEFDVVYHKPFDSWEKFGETISKEDPYHHLISIHNCLHFYDYNKPWITHCSIQRQPYSKPLEHMMQWREQYKKPIVIDEMCYEGDVCHSWGNIDAQEMVRKFWKCTVYGGYGGHGETYTGYDDILWWSHGGALHGESQQRLDFLYHVLQDIPGYGLKPFYNEWGFFYATPEISFDRKEFYLYYYDLQQPSYMEYRLNPDKVYTVEILDTWDMTISNVGNYSGDFTISLPRKKYIAVRITELEE